MLDEATRQRIMMQQEGTILASVGSYSDASTTCEIARCQLDGITNALIRMQGAKETAAFVFALSDRVAGGVRDVTDYMPPFLGGEPTVLEAQLIEASPLPAWRKLPWTGFSYGFLLGLVVMLAVTTLATGRM